VIDAVEFGAGDVVDAEAAGLHELHDLLDPDLAGIVNLERATRFEATVVNRKTDGPKERSVDLVKRTVDEDAGVVEPLCRSRAVGCLPGKRPKLEKMKSMPWRV
jgi:hypothetical protein